MADRSHEMLLELIKRGVKKAGNRSKLGQKIGVSHVSISDWETGSYPRLDKYLKLAEYVGEPTSLTPPPKGMVVAGKVSAGLRRLAVEDSREIAGLPAVWRHSVYHHLTDKANPVIYLEVDGDSMEPEFPDGCLLACGRPAFHTLPDLTPVIARHREEVTFKLYRLTKDRQRRPEVELLPLNRSYQIQRFDPRDIDVDYVVLGLIIPWTHGVVGAPPPNPKSPTPLLLRESSE